MLRVRHMKVKLTILNSTSLYEMHLTYDQTHHCSPCDRGSPVTLGGPSEARHSLVYNKKTCLFDYSGSLNDIKTIRVSDRVMCY